MQGRLENVQALRGAAAIAVVIAHLGGLYVIDPSIPRISVRAGVAGVDVFFVLSGFIIAWITRGEKWSASAAFLRNRFWRVAPLYWLLTLPELPWASIVAYARDGYIFPHWDFYLKSFLLIPSFSPGTMTLYPALNPGWTLFYEGVFYLVWFVLMIGDRRHLIFKVSAMLVIVYLSGFMSEENTPWNVFAVNPIMFEFILGICVARLMERRERAFMSAGFAVLAIVISCLSMIYLMEIFDLNYRLVTLGVPSAIILVAALELQRTGVLAPRILRFLGDASYAIYLAQAGTIAAVAKILAPLALGWPLKLALTATAAVTIGIVLHIVFERPIMRWREHGSLRDGVALTPALSAQK